MKNNKTFLLKVLGINLALVPILSFFAVGLIFDYDHNILITNNTELTIDSISMNYKKENSEISKKSQSKSIGKIGSNSQLKIPLNIGECSFDLSLKVKGKEYIFNCGNSTSGLYHVLDIKKDIRKSKCISKI